MMQTHQFPAPDLDLPDWIGSLGGAVWISTPNRRICFFNRAAERLLGFPATTCVGAPCFRSIAARRPDGRPFCARRCPIVRALEAHQRLEPLTLRCGEGSCMGRWLQLMVIPVRRRDPAGPYLVHCAWSADRAHRAEQYLARIASRSASLRAPGAAIGGLTRREREILWRLAMDEDTPTVAAKLHVSHATVRNHVQHILSKLQAHSIQEAVAVHVLRGASEPTPESCS